MPQVTVVTGGAGGMGLAAAALVASETSVLLADLRRDRLDAAVADLRQRGVECHSVVCDVTDRSSVEGLVDRSGSLGDVVAVVHAAGMSPGMGSADEILRANALGTLNVNSAFLSGAGDGFRIVNVASSAGHLPSGFPVPRSAYHLALSDPQRALEKLGRRCRVVPERLRPGIAYAISKNFVIWYSQQLAGRLGQVGARILSVSPGSFDTEMGRLEADSGSRELAMRSALGRYGRVSEIAEVLAFCASERAGYLTGVDVLVDGGAKATMSVRDMLAMARKR